MIIGIGVDVVDVPRVEAMVARFGDRVLQRLFTEGELRYLEARQQAPFAHAQSLAVRIAAKEAAYKALAGNDLARAVGWRDIEVVNAADGRPSIRFHGVGAERAAELRVTGVLVSLSHTHLTAVGMVVLEG